MDEIICVSHNVLLITFAEKDYWHKSLMHN